MRLVNLVRVICGETQGDFRVYEEGGVFSYKVAISDIDKSKCKPEELQKGGRASVLPAAFERLAGREASKKWKNSVRIYENGKEGEMVGKWLQRHQYTTAKAPCPTADPRRLQSDDSDHSAGHQQKHAQEKQQDVRAPAYHENGRRRGSDSSAAACQRQEPKRTKLCSKGLVSSAVNDQPVKDSTHENSAASSLDGQESGSNKSIESKGKDEGVTSGDSHESKECSLSGESDYSMDMTVSDKQIAASPPSQHKAVSKATQSRLVCPPPSSRAAEAAAAHMDVNVKTKEHELSQGKRIVPIDRAASNRPQHVRCVQASNDPHKQGCAAEAQSSAQPAELVKALAQVTGIVQGLQQETDFSEQEGIARSDDRTQQTSDLRVHRRTTIKRKERSDKAALAACAREIALLQGRNGDLEGEVRNGRSERAQLLTDLIRVETLHKEARDRCLAALKDQERIEAQLQQLQDQTEESSKKASARVSELEGSLSAERIERTKLHKEISRAKAASEKAAEGRDTAKKMLRDLELQLCKLQGQMEESKDSAKARIAGLEKQLAAKEAVCNRLQTEISTTETGLRRTREAHVAGEKRVGEVGAQLKTLREQVEENKKAASRDQAAVEDLKGRNEGLKADLAHSEQERAINLEKLAEYNTQVHKLLAEKSSHDAVLEAEKKWSFNTDAELRKARAEWRAANAGCLAAQEQVALLRQQEQKSLDRTLQLADQHASSADERIQTLEEQLEASQAETAIAKQPCTHLEAQLQQEKEDHAGSAEGLAAMSTKRSGRLEQEEAQLGEVLEDAVRANESLQQDVAALQAQIAAIAAERESAVNKMKGLKDQLGSSAAFCARVQTQWNAVIAQQKESQQALQAIVNLFEEHVDSPLQLYQQQQSVPLQIEGTISHSEGAESQALWNLAQAAEILQPSPNTW